jgi:hypothetical protein
MKDTKHIWTLMAAGLMLSLPAVAQQGPLNSIGDPPLPLNGVWQGPFDEFIGGPGNFFNETWTFNGPGEVQITDEYVTGDAYAVFDNGSFVGDSSSVPSAPVADYTTDPSVAWLDNNFSHFAMDFGGGAHSITIEETQIPDGYSDSTYAIRGVATPDGGFTVGLLGLALTGLGVIRRKI